MTTADFSFHLDGECPNTKARATTFRTAHSTVQTPVFMPVATHASLRGQDITVPESIGYQVLLANTYHLLLRPGVEVFKSYGGIHDFMRWPRSVLTDSGGFQLFSLSDHVNMSEEGAIFRSYVDGKHILLTPEVSIATQRAINSDIMMVLDQCIPATSGRPEMERAMHLTHRWAKRSLVARGDSTQAMFGIVQGGCFLDLRRQSAEHITALPFEGYAIGGVAVGEEKSLRGDVVAFTAELLPRDRPRYLMGVGTPLDLLEGVARGVDMFDCIIPTALGEQGRCFTYNGKMSLSRGVYAGSKEPIDTTCSCSTCRRFTRGYLHHLVKCGEHLAHTLVGVHNLTFYFRLMNDMRTHILAGTFDGFYREKREVLAASDGALPTVATREKRSRSPETIGDYELHTRGDFVSVKQISSGEVMHSVTDPLIEAETLYVSQSNLRERVKHSPLVVWDVGLGAATNAMAAIRAYEEVCVENEGAISPLEIVSFENDLDSLRLALQNPSRFKQARHRAPHILAKNGLWESAKGALRWSLMMGDFMDTMTTAPTPDIIFFDPFSYKTNPSLWTLMSFEKILKYCGQQGTALFTYSAATSVRAGLLAAGFYVARGAAAGPKEDTTVALSKVSTDSDRYPLLGAEWLGRWERSDSKMPLGIDATRHEEMAARIRGHVQFR